MRRFFLDGHTAVGETVVLPEGEGYHICRVLRLGPGEMVELLDGSGMIYRARLVETGRQVRAEILEANRDPALTGSVQLFLAQGQLKGQKMDMVVQKCTELGVNRLMPFWSSRCQGKLQELQGVKKLERYQRIVESACKQCLRPDLMTIDAPVCWDDLLTAWPEAEGRVRLLFWEEERQQTLHDVVLPETVREMVVVLGPEGGLSQAETESAKRQGWRTVSLGRRILRAETATLAAAALAQFLAGNI
jgi:16S rRNA (uracil1498-N3)-methyltransferase